MWRRNYWNHLENFLFYNAGRAAEFSSFGVVTADCGGVNPLKLHSFLFNFSMNCQG